MDDTAKKSKATKSCFRVLIEDKHCKGKMIGFTENRIMVFYKSDLLSLANLFGFMGSVLAPSQRALNRFLATYKNLLSRNFDTGLPDLGVYVANQGATSISIATEWTTSTARNIAAGSEEFGKQLTSLFEAQVETYYNADLETFSHLYGFMGSTLAPSQRALNHFLSGQSTISHNFNTGLPELGLRFTRQAASTLAIATITMSAFSSSAHALPTNGQVVSGDVTIQQSSTVMDVNSASNKAVVNFDQFNVAKNETVNFNLPSRDSAILNRVVGNDPSQIFGHINSNGQVFLANPNGILFARGSQVDTGSLFATTMSINNNDFLQGKYQFTQDNTKSPASVVNEGDINVASGGYAVLTGAAVDNRGNINAPGGHVELAVGEQITMTVDDGIGIHVTVDEKLKNQVTTLQNAISNSGAITAGGGIIKLQSALKDNLYDKAINNTGVIKADGLTFEGGHIKLIAEGQSVYNNGELTAVSGSDAASKGGEIEILGKTVELGANTNIDASGNAGGGTVLIGGDTHGTNAGVYNATNTFVAGGGNLKADALNSGDGGKVVVWSNENTYYGGNLSAKGAGNNGNGGFAEVSGKENLVFQGTADLSPGGSNGHYGDLLLDPQNITVSTGGGAAYANVSTFAANAGTTQTIDPSTLVGLAANVALQATNDITFSNALALTSASKTLTVQAGHDITVNAAVSTNNGAISMTAGNNIVLSNTVNAGTSTVTLTADGTVNGVAGDGTGGISGTSTITGSTVTLSSSQAIGSSVSRINTSTSNLAVTTTNANAYVTNSGALNIAASSLGSGLLDVRANNNLTLTGALSATGGVTLASTATNGSIALGANNITATGSTATLTATGTGTITTTTGAITASTVNLNSSTGAIGTSGNRILTTASTVSANTSNGTAYITNTGAVNIAASNVGSGLLDVKANNNLTLSGVLSGTGGVSIVSTAANGSIGLGTNTITATGSTATLTATGTGTITASAGSNITASTINFTSGTGAIGTSGNNILTTASTISATATNANAYISNSGALTLNATSIGTGILSVTNDNSITLGGNLSATGGITLNVTGNNGGIGLNTRTLTATGATVSLTANGSGTITETTATITGTTVNLNSGTGAIGTSGNRILTTATNVSANTSNGSAYITNTGAVNIAASNVGSGLLDVKANNNLTLSGVLSGTGGVSIVSTAANGSIGLGTNTITATGSTATLTATGTGTITASAGSNITASTINFTSGTGAIGTSGNNILTTASTISATATNANAYISNSGALTLNATSIGTGILSVTNDNSITLGGNLSATGGITLNVTGNNGGIDLNSRTITATGATVSLTANGSGTITETTATITGTTVNLNSGTGNIGTSSNRILTTATNVSANTSNGSAYITNTGAVNIAASSLGSGLLDVRANNNLTLTGNLSATGGVTLTSTATNGSIALGTKTITATGATVALTATGTGTISASAGSNITASTVTFSGGTGTMGTSANKILTTASTISGSATNAALYVSNSGALTVNATSIGTGALSITNDNNITLGGSLSATGGVTLTSTAVNGSIALGNYNITDTGNTTTLTATGSGTITTGTGAITATTVALVSGTGDIGTTSNRILTTATNVSANTSNGSAYITNTGAVNIAASALGSGALNVRANNNLTLTGNISATGGVNIASTATNGSITVGIRTITATGATVGLTATGTGTITASAGSNITANTVNLTSGTGAIGSSGANILTTASNVSATATNANANISNTGDLTINASSLGTGTLTVIGSANMTVGGAITSAVTILSTVNNLTTNAGISSSNGITLTADNAGANNGNLSISSSGSLTSTGNINLYGAQMNIAGNVSTNSANSISFIPTISKSITIGNSTTNNDSSTIFDIDNTELTKLTAKRVYIGSLTIGDSTHGITTVGDITILAGTPGTTAGSYSIGLQTAGAVTIGNNIITNNNGFIASVDQFRLLSSGSINTGTANLNVQTNYTNKAINFFGSNDDADTSGTSGILDISSAEMSRMTTGLLILGLTNYSGGISSTGDVTLASGTAGTTQGAYAIRLDNAGFVNINNTINTNGNNFTVQSDGFRLLSPGSINTGSGSTYLYTNMTNKAITVDGLVDDADTSSASGIFDVSAAELARITTSNLTIGSTSYSGGITVQNNLNTSGSGGVTAGAYTVYLQNAGNINIGNYNINTGTNNLTIQAASTGAITAGTGVLATSGALQLTSATGAIGTSGNNILTSASTIAVTTTNGNTYISNTGATTLNASSLGTGSLTLNSSNTITLNGTLSATGGVTLNVTGNNGGIDLNSRTITATGATVSLTANGSGTITETTATITGTTVNLNSGTGNIGTSSNRILTTATNVSANTSNGSAYITNTGAVNIAASSLGSGLLDVRANNNLTLTGNLSATGGVTLTSTATNGSIALGTKTITATGATVALTATGTGTISASAGSNITASTVTFSGGTGTMGTSANKILTTASTISGSATNAALYVSNSGALTVNATSIGTGALSITNDNNITLGGSLSATGGVTLTSTAANGSIALGNYNITDTGNTTTLTATGSGTITTGTGAITATTVALVSGTGDIGTTSNRILTTATNLSANTSNGGVYVTNTGAAIIGTSNLGSGLLDVRANNNITLSGSISATGGVNLASTAVNGTIGMGNNNIVATGATVNLTATGTSAISTGTGVITANTVNLTSGSGAIGTSSNNILTTASNVSITSSNGAALIKNTGDLTLNTVSLGSGSLSVSGTNNITVAGAITDSSTVLTASNDININAAITSTTNGSITLNADGAVNAGSADGNGSLNISSTGSLANTGGTITLKGAQMSIAGNVSAGTNGNIYLQPTVTKEINIGNSITGNDSASLFDIDSTEMGKLTAANVYIGSLTLGDSTHGLSTAGNITLASGTIGTTAGAYQLTLYNAGAVNINHAIVTQNKGVSVYADTFRLLSSGSINVGTTNVGIYSNNSLKATTIGGANDDADTAGTSGNLDISAAELARITTTNLVIGTNINPSNISYTGNIYTTGNIGLSNGTIGTSAGAYNLSFITNGATTLNNNINTGNGSLSISTGTLAQGANNYVTASSVNLTATTGNIGTSNNRFSVNTTTLSVNATLGSAYINNTTSSSVTLNASTLTNGTLDYTGDSSTIINGNLLARSISLVTPGDMTIRSGVTVSATGSGNSLTLASTNGYFYNYSGANALSAASGGRWLVYAKGEGYSLLGGLTGNKYYNYSYTGNPPSSISAGNSFVFGGNLPNLSSDMQEKLSQPILNFIHNTSTNMFDGLPHLIQPQTNVDIQQPTPIAPLINISPMSIQELSGAFSDSGASLMMLEDAGQVEGLKPVGTGAQLSGLRYMHNASEYGKIFAQR